jgi:hypothetical protein
LSLLEEAYNETLEEQDELFIFKERTLLLNKRAREQKILKDSNLRSNKKIDEFLFSPTLW